MAAAYSEAVRQRCREPRRAGGFAADVPSVGTGDSGSLESGAWTRLQVRVSPRGVIDDARFRVFGCSAALASASFVADAVVGSSPRAAASMSAASVAEALALPDDKQAMAALATEAARAAVADWQRKTEEQARS